MPWGDKSQAFVLGRSGPTSSSRSSLCGMSPLVRRWWACQRTGFVYRNRIAVLARRQLGRVHRCEANSPVRRCRTRDVLSINLTLCTRRRGETASPKASDENMRQIDLRNETVIALSEVPNHLPKRNGKKTHYATVYRWALKGARGRILESTLIGGVRYTSLEALQRFLDGRTSAATPTELDATLDRVLTENGK